MSAFEFSNFLLEKASLAEEKIRPSFAAIDEIAAKNTAKVLEAFAENRVSDACFGGTTGYGYDDLGREKLDAIYARVFGAEAALVRSSFVNGTHTIASAMYATVSCGDVFLSATGDVYDTLQTVTGQRGKVGGTFADYGIEYRKVELKNGLPDLERIAEAAKDPRVKGVFVQRSKGYSDRETLSCRQIGEVCRAVKTVNPQAAVVVDNCYGEFVETIEPSDVGADLVVGSLIKNPGGGLAPIGGYIAGRKELIDACGYRLTSPGLGKEVGASLGVMQSFYQGLFLAPTVTAGALKGAVFAANIYEKLGFPVVPDGSESRHDIIQAVTFGKPEGVIAFCKGIQAAAPVESFVTPIPWAMPGYDSDVIMAAGAFVQGSSIELSADGPIKPPYAVYFQGGLTWHHARLGILMSLEYLAREGLVVL